MEIERIARSRGLVYRLVEGIEDGSSNIRDIVEISRQ